MILNFTTNGEDDLLTKCSHFGGDLDEVAQIAARLDDLLSINHKTIGDLEDELKITKDELEKLQAYVDKHADYLTAIDNLQS